MKSIHIYRHWQDDNQTLGTMVVFDEENKPLFSSVTIERGWRNNKRGESCVPVGVYDIELEYSPRFDKDLWELKDVINRSECKIHTANHWHQLHGCIAPGVFPRDIDGDGYIDVLQSGDTMKAFHKAMGDSTKALCIIQNTK